MKKCSQCKEIKSIKEFYLHKQSKDKHSSWCKVCHKFIVKSNWKYKRRWQVIKATYGLSRSEYEQMYRDQKGQCASCKKPNLDGRALCVDHNHITNQVRGLLCDKCNIFLGFIENNPGLLEKVLEYQKFTLEVVLKLPKGQ